jgi:hypothetical protein
MSCALQIDMSARWPRQDADQEQPEEPPSVQSMEQLSTEP